MTEQALRVAVSRLDLAEAVRFDAEFHQVWQEAVQTDSTVPMHTFLFRWAVFVELRRYPRRADRLRELEEIVGRAADVDAARDAAKEISQMLGEATLRVRR
ncbi:hypothetical protein ACFWTE_10595 [Nocardiopsis sp. NPDC058631]|uniref:hypothetical protein n=1 Tax=Nocardiopsis sp. NPDC058631 TaxID=3346566 RepID=UPI0036663EF0